MSINAPGRTIPGAVHDRIAVNGTHLHCVSLGTSGSPVLLVHGFPESWWAFQKVMPLLAERHRVHAVDLRGFGDSDLADGAFDSTVAAEDLHQLIAALGEGPVHLVAQDISGTTAFRLAATHPDAIASFTAIEMGLPGFGLEAFADVTNGGAWYFGVLAAPGIADLLLAGRETAFVGGYPTGLLRGEALPLACQAAAQPVQQSQQQALGVEGGYWRAQSVGLRGGEQVAGADAGGGTGYLETYGKGSG